jgi:hypothetical protein
LRYNVKTFVHFDDFFRSLLAVRYIESLLYQVKPGDPSMLAFPALTILAATVVAALPPMIHALRIDPAMMLRAE